MADALINQAVVIDNGSGFLKAGYAGDQEPRCVCPSYVGRLKHVKVMAGGLSVDQGRCLLGETAQKHKGLLRLKYPMEHGIVDDWDDMELLWKHVYDKDMLRTAPEDHPVLLTEAPLNPRKNRNKAAEILFESLNVPALFVSMQAVLSLYASGKVTGVVLDCGDGVTHAVPVYEGFAMKHSIRRMDVAGRDVTRHLHTLLRRFTGYNFRTSAELEIVRSIKEKACYVAENPKEEEKEFDDPPDRNALKQPDYVLPDGNKILIGQAKFRAPEVLFSPDIIGEECGGVQDVLCEAIQKSDMDLRRTLYENIILSGGSTLFQGFGKRLIAEVKKRAPMDIRLKISAPAERHLSTYRGGAIFASLDTFKDIWVTKKEWDEEGAFISRKAKLLDKKFFV